MTVLRLAMLWTMASVPASLLAGQLLARRDEVVAAELRPLAVRANGSAAAA